MGLSFSVPLSVIGSLVAPRVDRWWSARSERRSNLSKAREDNMAVRAKAFSEHDDAFSRCLWNALFRCWSLTLAGFFAIAASLLAMASLFGVRNDDTLGRIL